MSKPTFILGVGAQKAGTSWLHFQLNLQPTVDMGCMKEYHVWDAKFSNLARSFAVLPKKHEQSDTALRRMMQTTHKVYEKYFTQLIRDGVQITGDMTPSYSTLNANDFDRIRVRLEDAGFRVKPIFVMRDPVERNWSAFKKKLTRKHGVGCSIDDFSTSEVFKNFYSNKQRVQRTNYPATINSLYSCFPPRDIFIGIYEEIFRPESINRLSNFLEIDLSNVDIATKINESNSTAIPIQVRDNCRDFYDDVYNYCYDSYPLTQRLWTPNRQHVD